MMKNKYKGVPICGFHISSTRQYKHCFKPCSCMHRLSMRRCLSLPAEAGPHKALVSFTGIFLGFSISLAFFLAGNLLHRALLRMTWYISWKTLEFPLLLPSTLVLVLCRVTAALNGICLKGCIWQILLEANPNGWFCPGEVCGPMLCRESIQLFF